MNVSNVRGPYKRYLTDESAECNRITKWRRNLKERHNWRATNDASNIEDDLGETQHEPYGADLVETHQDGDDSEAHRDGDDLADLEAYQDGDDLADLEAYQDGDDLADLEAYQDGDDLADLEAYQDGDDLEAYQDLDDLEAHQDGDDLEAHQDGDDLADLEAYQDGDDLEAHQDGDDLEAHQDGNDLEADQDGDDLADLEAHQDGNDFVDANEMNPSDLTSGQCVALVMSYVAKHNVSGVQLKDLLALLNLILPGTMPKSKYFLEKQYFCNSLVKKNFYCKDCQHLLGENPAPFCPCCNLNFDKNVSLKEGYYFMVMSVEDQLKCMFEKENIAADLIDRNVRNDNVCDVCDGQAYKKHMEFLSQPDNISFSWNTDGAPVFHSSNFSIWPIFLTINEVVPEKRSKFILLHSLWFGPNKPNMSTFLKPFVDDMQHLHTEGFQWKEQVTGLVHTSKCLPLIASVDSVARAPMQGIKQFNGQYGCGFCLHPGRVVPKGLGSTRVYPLSYPLPPKRTHANMLADAEQTLLTGECINGMKEVSPLSLLPGFDLAESFVPDYMHCLLLGAVRQVTNMLFDSVHHKKEFYLGKKLNEADNLMTKMSPPSEIRRYPRSITQRVHWKASEWRAFLLFYSPVVFEKIMLHKFFVHWLLLFHAIHLLITRSISQDDIRTARLCLIKFVFDFEKLYGAENVSYNVHLLTHLCESVVNFGPLWSSSAFLFEDGNRTLLAMTHGTRGIESQTVSRFLAYRKIRVESALQMQGAPEEAQSVLMQLTNMYTPLKNATTVRGFVGLGAPKSTFLSLLEQELIEDVKGQETSKANCFSFGRGIIHGSLITTSSYSDTVKKNDSVISINGIWSAVEKMVVGKFCVCIGVCDCEKEMFVFGRVFRILPTNRYQDPFSGAVLHSKWQRVQLSNELVCSAANHVTKGVLVNGANHDTYVVTLPVFEMD